MIDPDIRPWHTELEFNAPLSAAHADELVTTLQPLRDVTIVDLGCGWGEFLLRVLEREVTARGIGVDGEAAAIARARRNAAIKGVDNRVQFECGDATRWSGKVERAIVVGSSHAWGGTRATLDAMRALLPPDGILLLGEGIWEQPATPAALAALDARPDDFTTLAGLVDLCLACGYRVLSHSTASRDEWDSFETNYCAGADRWLREHPDSPDADEMRITIDAHRDGWLQGYRDVLGFAYLTLAVPAAPR